MSKQKSWKKYLIAFFVVVLIGTISLFVVWSEVFAAKLNTKDGKEMRVYVDKDENLADFVAHLEADSVVSKPKMFMFACRVLGLKPTTILPAGCYPVFPEMTHLQLIQRVQRGEQVPVRLTINYMRLPEQFASKVSKQLMMDSVEIMNFVTDKEKMAELKLWDKSTQTVYNESCMFVFKRSSNLLFQCGDLFHDSLLFSKRGNRTINF